MAHGDHIMVKRWGGLYYHHGIDMGDGTIIHFSGEPLKRENARVCRCALDEFLRGGRKIAVGYAKGIEVLPVEETIRLAEDLLEDTGYSLFSRNCEHFATFCKTGKPASEQVMFYVRAGATVALVCVAVAGAALGAKVLDWNGGGPHA